jgi:cytochrome b6-f complex iron-sulfur subunit
MTEKTRRDFLKLSTTALLTASGLLGIGGLLRFLDYQTEPTPRTEFDLGLSSDYAVNSTTIIPDAAAVLFHKEDGFSALSLACTHLGCTVEQKPAGFTCPCHGSRYDANGNVLRGPAKKPLRALRVESASDGHLILHTD